MILQNVINDYEGIKYDGANTAEVLKFVQRHGAVIDWQTDNQGTTRGYLQTMQGTVDIVRGMTLLCGIDDQVFQVFPKDIGDAYPAKYKIVSEDEDARIGAWTPPQDTVPVVEEPKTMSLNELADQAFQPTPASSGIIRPDAINGNVMQPEPPPSLVLTAEERLARLESIILQLAVK